MFDHKKYQQWINLTFWVNTPGNVGTALLTVGGAGI
jgi:hypothetical protein